MTHKAEERKESEYSQYAHAILLWITTNIATLVVGGIMFMVIMYLLATRDCGGVAY